MFDVVLRRRLSEAQKGRGEISRVASKGNLGRERGVGGYVSVRGFLALLVSIVPGCRLCILYTKRGRLAKIDGEGREHGGRAEAA
jgi:hypothetical protein